MGEEKMAQLTFSGLGSLATSAIGLGPTLGWFAGSMLGGSFQKKPLIEGPRLKDPSIQSAAYGMPIPVIYGRQKIAGNIIWSSGIVESVQKKKKYVQGQRVKLKLYHYHTNFALALCEGPIDSVLRIWANDELIYDASAGGNKRQHSKNPFRVRIYKGDEAQTPDALIAAKEGSDQTPAFRGLAYVVFENFCLDEYHGRVPQFSFEVSTKSEEHFDHQTIALASLNQDQSFLSDDGLYLYAVHSNRILKIDRKTNKMLLDEVYTRIVPEDTEEATIQFQGRTLYDRKRNVFYSLAHRGRRALIVAIDALTLKIKGVNLSARLDINETLVGFCGAYVVSFHTLNGRLSFHHKESLVKSLEGVDTPLYKGAGASFSNAMTDDLGHMWVLQNASKNPEHFHLFKLESNGHFNIYTFEDYGQGRGIVFDTLTQKMVVIAQKALLRIDEGGTIEKVLKKDFSAIYVWSTYTNQERVSGFLYAPSAKGVHVIDLVAFKQVRLYKASIWGTLLTGLMVDDENGCFWAAHRGLQKLYRDRYRPHPMCLKDVLIALCVRAGIETFDFEAHAVFDQPVYGLLLQGHENIKSVLQMLMSVYQIQVREHEGVVWFLSLHQKPHLTLEKDKIGAFDESFKGKADITLNHKGAKEMLSQLSLIYQSLEHFYTHRVVEISGNEYRGGAQKVMGLSLLLPDSQAAQLGTNIFERENVESSQLQLQLPPFYMHLLPGDVVAFDDQGRKRYARFENMTLGANGLLKAQGKMLTHLEPSLFETLDTEGQIDVIDDVHLKELVSLNDRTAVTLEGAGTFEGAFLYFEVEEDIFEEIGTFSGYVTKAKVVEVSEYVKVELSSKLSPDIVWLFDGEKKRNIHLQNLCDEGKILTLECDDLEGFENGQTLYLGSDENCVEKPEKGNYKALLKGVDDDESVFLKVD